MNISHFFTSRILPLVAISAALSLTLNLSQPAAAQTTVSSPTITTLHTFDQTYGNNPSSRLLLASDGYFYGTIFYGGYGNNGYGYGTIYRISPTTHQLATLIKFNNANGRNPNGNLIQASDGSIYGVTVRGGDSDDGVVFQFTAPATLHVLHHFHGDDGSELIGGLIQGTDGNLYGTTELGADRGGTIFRLSPSGAFKTLYKFSKPTGAYPEAALVQDTDGSLYGTTRGGGKYDKGVVFRLRPNGSYAVLHTFDGPYGARSYAGLTKGADGAFYGTTHDGGIIGADNQESGTLFKITSTGQFTTLHKFDKPAYGRIPSSGLTLGPDGNFYGTTVTGGTTSAGNGTVFQMTPIGTVSILYRFVLPAHGYQPFADLSFGVDGALYGTTREGGVINGQTVDYGTIFKLTLP